MAPEAPGDASSTNAAVKFCLHASAWCRRSASPLLDQWSCDAHLSRGGVGPDRVLLLQAAARGRGRPWPRPTPTRTARGGARRRFDAPRRHERRPFAAPAPAPHPFERHGGGGSPPPCSRRPSSSPSCESVHLFARGEGRHDRAARRHGLPHRQGAARPPALGLGRVGGRRAHREPRPAPCGSLPSLRPTMHPRSPPLPRTAAHQRKPPLWCSRTATVGGAASDPYTRGSESSHGGNLQQFVKQNKRVPEDYRACARHSSG